MAESGLLIKWGDVYPGREQQAMNLFTETAAYYAKLIEEARISNFEPFLVKPHGDGSLNGFWILRGGREQLSTLSGEDEFIGYSARAHMCLRDFGVIELYYGESLTGVLRLWAQQIANEG